MCGAVLSLVKAACNSFPIWILFPVQFIWHHCKPLSNIVSITWTAGVVFRYTVHKSQKVLRQCSGIPKEPPSVWLQLQEFTVNRPVIKSILETLKYHDKSHVNQLTMPVQTCIDHSAFHFSAQMNGTNNFGWLFMCMFTRFLREKLCLTQKSHIRKKTLDLNAVSV